MLNGPFSYTEKFILLDMSGGYYSCNQASDRHQIFAAGFCSCVIYDYLVLQMLPLFTVSCMHIYKMKSVEAVYTR
jgi:hypothetical protein